MGHAMLVQVLLQGDGLVQTCPVWVTVFLRSEWSQVHWHSKFNPRHISSTFFIYLFFIFLATICNQFFSAVETDSVLIVWWCFLSGLKSEFSRKNKQSGQVAGMRQGFNNIKLNSDHQTEEAFKRKTERRKTKKVNKQWGTGKTQSTQKLMK